MRRIRSQPSFLTYGFWNSAIGFEKGLLFSGGWGFKTLGSFGIKEIKLLWGTKMCFKLNIKKRSSKMNEMNISFKMNCCSVTDN